MATINATGSADILVPSNNGDTYRGLGGDDTYIIGTGTVAANAKVTIVDTSGANKIQLVDGLSITASKFAADSVQLTLSNGAVVTINGADKFTYDVGGNSTAGLSGTSNSYAQLAAGMGVASLPSGSTISEGGSGTVSGASLSTGSIGYSVSASANSVAEGSSLTYTITATSAPASDVVLTYNVVGDTKDGTVDKAGSSDLVSLSGTVTLPAGETSVTFNITPNKDDSNEGLEGIKVTVFDDALESIGSSVALISNTASTASTTSNLTTGVDTIAAGDGNNTIGGTVQAAGATGSTANPGDVVDGGNGNDVFKLSIAGTLTANVEHSISGIELVGVEEISVNNFQVTDGANTFHTLDLSLMPDVTKVGVNSSSPGGKTVITNLPRLVEVTANSGHGDLTIDYKAATVAGTADAQTLNLMNYGNGLGSSGTISLDSVENITVNSSGLNIFAAITAAVATSYTFTGTGYTLIAGALSQYVASIDASASSGGISITVNPISQTYALAITGGSGNDKVNFDSTFNIFHTYDGGAGSDTIKIDDPADITVTSTAGLTSVEVLDAGANAGTAYNLAYLPGVTSLVSSAASAGDEVTFSNMTDDNSTVTIASSTAAPEGAIGTRFIDTDDDTVNITAGQTTVAQQTIVAVTFNDAETMNLTTNPNNAGSATIFTTIGGTDLATLNVGGLGKTQITAIGGGTLLTKIDASGSGGGLVMPATNPSATFGVTIIGSERADTLEGGTSASRGDTISGNGGADIIQGGAGPDTITGGSGADIIRGEGGIDNLSGGAGNDTFINEVIADFEGLATAETVDGGEGALDILNFGAAVNWTIEATDLEGVTGIERITVSTTDTTQDTLALNDTFFANNGDTIDIRDTEAAVGLTVSLAAVTSADYSATVRSANGAAKNDLFTGGPGNDTFIFASTADADVIDGNDTIAGGLGSDTLSITTLTIAAAITATTTVTSIENFNFSGVGTLTSAYTLADQSVVTSALQANTGTIDATKMTGSGGLTFNGVAENDSALNITGGRGGDTLTGGDATASLFDGSALFDTIKGGDGADTIDGQAGIDMLYGEGGNDIFRVTASADFLALTSPETVDGGTGTDNLTFDVDGGISVAASDLQNLNSIEVIEFEGTGADSLTLSDSVFTANGTTSIRIDEVDASATFTLSAAGVSAANSITYRLATASNMANDADATESLTFGAGDDVADFRDGLRLDTADVIAFGGGNDTLSIWNTGAISATLTNVSGVENISIVDAGTGAITLTLADGNFVGTQVGTISNGGAAEVLTLDADAEDDSSLTITGGTGNDSIIGTDARLSGTTVLGDTINGGNGADTITGSLGADTITGGAGADVFNYDVVADSAGSYVDSVTDFLDGTDTFTVTIDRSSDSAGRTINGATTAGQATVQSAQDALTGEIGQAIYVTDTGHLYINANSDNLFTSLDYKIKVNSGATAKSTFDATNDDNISWTLKGGSGADTITGAGLVDTITGGAGDDILSGLGGADIISSVSGSNNISGGAGIDTITGGTGVDIISGNAGADIINANQAGADVIAGGDGADVINITDTTAIDTVQLADDDLGTTYTSGILDAGVDVVTGFDPANGKDTIELDISAITALTNVTDLVRVGDGASITTTSASVVLDGGTDATNMDNEVTASVLLLNAAPLTIAALQTALEAGGDNAVTHNGGFAIGDAYLVIADDSINSALFLIIVGGNGIANNEQAADGELTAVKLLTYAGFTTAENFVASATDFVV
jgi:Ca2+-binding RTX toxin-like protein